MSDLFNISARVGLDTSAFDAGMDHIELRLDKALQAFADFAAESVKSYSSYEQLRGGVEALYGSAAGTVLANASTASTRMGMSENDYLTNAIKYSAVLLNDLEGNAEEAARIVDVAMGDMMDNANRIGTNVSMLQTAYNGFARESFRSLGNLNLGYGNAKASMEELLADASAITGKEYDMQRFADIIEAIHVIQDQIGITGTTQQEATTTIQGSVNVLKSSYSDFKTDFVADNGEIIESFNTMTESLAVAAENVAPRIASAFNNAMAIMGQVYSTVYGGRSAYGTGIRDLYDSLQEESQRRGQNVSIPFWDRVPW